MLGNEYTLVAVSIPSSSGPRSNSGGPSDQGSPLRAVSIPSSSGPRSNSQGGINLSPPRSQSLLRQVRVLTTMEVEVCSGRRTSQSLLRQVRVLTNVSWRLWMAQSVSIPSSSGPRSNPSLLAIESDSLTWSQSLLRQVRVLTGCSGRCERDLSQSLLRQVRVLTPCARNRSENQRVAEGLDKNFKPSPTC